MPFEIDATRLTGFVGALFEASGLDAGAAHTVAEGLVEADLLGLASHGVMLAEMYVSRLRAGSVSVETEAQVVSDRGVTAVLDGRHGFGVLMADQAMTLAIEKARAQGAGVVAVRHAFHFGAARRFALLAAEQDCVGIALCNTRPLMPAPGGATRAVGNNPLAIAFPTAGEAPLVLDMATSEAAMGKIRVAAKAGREIPANWAVKADGSPTTDPNEAINGMLLPTAGPKGFGLAVMIDLLVGVLSGGANGGDVQPLFGDTSIPYDCSHLFIAIDTGHFGHGDQMKSRAERYAEAIRQGARAPGVDRLFTPGEPEWERSRAARGRVRIEESVWTGLIAVATELGVDASLVESTPAIETIN